MKEIDYDLIGAKIKTGCVYEITHFHSARSKTSHKVVPHAAHLFFNTRTVFTELSSVYPQIPRHRFYFLDFGQLCTRIDKNEILTGNTLHILQKYAFVYNIYLSTIFMHFNELIILLC